ncbi:MAG: hypothetical protein CMH55_05370 [Myxococcales bacterium]|nr:hypothetical protein [Myxococcales bacterium]
MSIHRTGNPGSKPPVKPSPAGPTVQTPQQKPVRSEDRFEGMTRPEGMHRLQAGERTGLTQALESSSPTHEVLNEPSPEGFDEALDEFNLLLLQHLRH